MNKSRRINELARDLEVKSSAVLDKLKELGISGKTHSSSVDEDVAEQLRVIFHGGEPAPRMRKSAAEPQAQSALAVEPEKTREREVSPPVPSAGEASSGT